jgi:O-antigen ligase
MSSGTRRAMNLHTNLHLAHLSSFGPKSSTWIAQRAAEYSVIGVICVSILAPPIRFSDSFPYVRAEQVLLALIVVGYTWFLLAGYARTIRFNGMFVVGGLYCACVATSIWYGAILLSHPVGLRDFYEIPKILFPVAFFTVAYEAELSETSLRRLMKFFSIAILLACLYGWAQFANLGIAARLNPYYSGGEHIDLLLQYVGRVYSTMANPNVLGQLLSWAIVAFVMAVLFGVGNRAWNLLIILVCLATLAMTASRYGVLTSTLGIALIFLVSPLFLRRRVRPLLLLVLALPVFALTLESVATTNQFAIQRLLTLKDPLQTDSARDRFNRTWPDAIADFSRSPVIGNGPMKDFSDIITDSEYLDVLKEFGVVGFLPYLAYFVYPLFLVSRGLRASRRIPPLLEEKLPATSLTARLSFIMILLALVMNIGESTLYNLLLQAFLWTWAGLGARASEALAHLTYTTTRMAYRPDLEADADGSILVG